MLLINILFSFGLVSCISLCDKYTTALFTNNTAENQLTLITLVVNTAIIGNYTKGAMNVVPGILAHGDIDGKMVNLLPFFDGSMNTTNVNNMPVKVNFLDDGGASPLLLNKPANGMNSKQYTLVTHLYKVFGGLLECSQQSNGSVFKSYDGVTSMFEVHKFMKLDNAQVMYFIKQVGLAALSFGVSMEDTNSIGNTLTNLFLMKCDIPIALVPGAIPDSQSICIADDCPVAKSCTSTPTFTPMSNSANRADRINVFYGLLGLTLF